MKQQANVTLEAFKDEVLTACKDGDYRLTVATMAFVKALTPEEVAEGLRFAAHENVELIFVPDVTEYEPDYNPQNEEARQFAQQQRIDVTIYPEPLNVN